MLYAFAYLPLLDNVNERFRIPYIPKYRRTAFGRFRELEQLQQYVLGPSDDSAQRRVLIHGIGGIGKKHLAALFAQELRSEFTAVFWINGVSISEAYKSFNDIFECLPISEDLKQFDEICGKLFEKRPHDLPVGFPNQDEKKVAAFLQRNLMIFLREQRRAPPWRKVANWLAHPANRHWLLIFDNVDLDHRPHSLRSNPDAFDVTQFFPQCDHGATIVTSRLRRLEDSPAITYSMSLKICENIICSSYSRLLCSERSFKYVLVSPGERT